MCPSGAAHRRQSLRLDLKWRNALYDTPGFVASLLWPLMSRVTAHVPFSPVNSAATASRPQFLQALRASPSSR